MISESQRINTGQKNKLICLSDEESTLRRAIRKSNSKASVALKEILVIKQRKAKRGTLSNTLSVFPHNTHSSNLVCTVTPVWQVRTANTTADTPWFASRNCQLPLLIQFSFFHFGPCVKHRSLDCNRSNFYPDSGNWCKALKKTDASVWRTLSKKQVHKR